MSFEYMRYLFFMREENFVQKASSEAWVLYPDDLTSMGLTLSLSAMRKSTS